MCVIRLVGVFDGVGVRVWGVFGEIVGGVFGGEKARGSFAYRRVMGSV